MTGVKSPCPSLQQAWGELLTTMPPMMALYARFVHTQSMEQLLWTTIPTIRARSCRIFRPRGIGPLRQLKLQGPILHAGYKTRYDGARRYNTERQKPLPQAVACMPRHVAAVPGVPMPCLYTVQTTTPSDRAPRGPRAASPARITHTPTSCNPAPP
jgi:hypothetical protein